jgi:DNA-binding transcriptional ArsR family regulator
MSSSTADEIFGALADATRRTILDLLRDHDHMTAGQIADRFPRISRPAVSKHLRVLRQAGLVEAREQGRENHYTLDARPLAEVQRGWLDEFAPHWERSLEELKRQTEKRRHQR